MALRKITAEDYQNYTGGDFDEIFTSEFCETEIWDVANCLNEDGTITLYGHFGEIAVSPDTELYVR